MFEIDENRNIRITPGETANFDVYVFLGRVQDHLGYEFEPYDKIDFYIRDLDFANDRFMVHKTFTNETLEKKPYLTINLLPQDTRNLVPYRLKEKEYFYEIVLTKWKTDEKVQVVPPRRFLVGYFYDNEQGV